MDNKLKGDLEI